MEWKFEEGIVATKTTGSFTHKVYYVRYKSETSNLRRIVSASFVYSSMEITDRDKFIQSIVTKDERVYMESFGKSRKIVPKMSKVVSIMDFDFSEKDQQPKDIKYIEKSYELLTNTPEDSDENYLSLKYFERNLPICDYRKCVCTLTNDDECKRRIDEVIANSVKETYIPPPPQPNTFDQIPGGSAAYLQKILELQTIIVKQRDEIKALRARD